MAFIVGCSLASGSIGRAGIENLHYRAGCDGSRPSAVRLSAAVPSPISDLSFKPNSAMGLEYGTPLSVRMARGKPMKARSNAVKA